MAKYARLDGANTVIEIFESDTYTPSDTHMPDIAAQFIACPDTVTVGYVKVGTAWNAPASASAVPSLLPKLTPMTFYLAFTVAERMAIKGSSDPTVKEFWDTYQRSQDTGTMVDPNLVSVQEGLAYLATPTTATPPGLGILASTARIQQILAGVPQ